MGKVKISMVTEFKGSVPDVPFYDDVDVKALTEGDADPVFVTMKLAKANVTSESQYHYDQDFVDKLEKQLYARRTGNRGHLPVADRESKYEVPKVYWVGANQEDGILYGRGYVPKSSDMREVAIKSKAANAQMGTSIYGTSEPQYDKARGAFIPKDFELESIDFADPSRAGIPDLNMVPVITSEMATEYTTDKKDNQEEKPDMDKLQIISEMTASDARHIPETIVQEIEVKSDAAKLLGQITAVYGEDPLKAMKEKLAGFDAMQAKIEEIEVASIDAAIVSECASQIMKDDESDGAKDMRTMVAELAKAKRPKDAAAVKAVIAEIANTEHIKGSIKRIIVAEMGPNHQGGAGNGGTIKLDTSPEAVAAARARNGI